MNWRCRIGGSMTMESSEPNYVIAHLMSDLQSWPGVTLSIQTSRVFKTLEVYSFSGKPQIPGSQREINQHTANIGNRCHQRRRSGGRIQVQNLKPEWQRHSH